jgi:hypothetical protein
MALTLAVASGYGSALSIGDATTNYIAAVTNPGSDVVLGSLTVNESTKSGAVIAQPIITTGVDAPGVDNPTLVGGTTTYFSFSIVFAPVSPGPSPQSANGSAGQPGPAYSGISFVVTSYETTGKTTASTSFFVPTISALPPFPPSLGGALQLNGGANLINLIVL